MTKEEAKQELEGIKLVYEIFKKGINEYDKRIAELEAIINKKDEEGQMISFASYCVIHDIKYITAQTISEWKKIVPISYIRRTTNNYETKQNHRSSPPR